MNQSTNLLRPANPDDQNLWNTHVDHPLQAWEWGEFREKMGVEIVRFIRGKKGQYSQRWQLSFHRIPHTPFTIGYFPKGPIPDQFMIDELTKLGKQKNTIYIQLEPNVFSHQLSAPIQSESAISFQNVLKSHHPLFTKYTFILDMTKTEEELLKYMHNKTRYNIRLAQKHGVVIKEDSSDTAFHAYLSLSEETTRRQRFYAHNRHYHETMWDTMKKNNMAKLFTATYQNEILSAWIIFCHGDTIYYPYGASSRNHREVMAPNLMLWEIVRWAKRKGYKNFDLWGALGPEPESHDPWYGFHRFKEGYHPTLVEYVGSYDLVINSIVYKLYCIGDTIRWALLKLKIKLF